MTWCSKAPYMGRPEFLRLNFPRCAHRTVCFVFSDSAFPPSPAPPGEPLPSMDIRFPQLQFASLHLARPPSRSILALCGISLSLFSGLNNTPPAVAASCCRICDWCCSRASSLGFHFLWVCTEKSLLGLCLVYFDSLFIIMAAPACTPSPAVYNHSPNSPQPTLAAVSVRWPPCEWPCGGIEDHFGLHRLDSSWAPNTFSLFSRPSRSVLKMCVPQMSTCLLVCPLNLGY